jgi:hypothetical protein
LRESSAFSRAALPAIEGKRAVYHRLLIRNVTPSRTLETRSSKVDDFATRSNDYPPKLREFFKRTAQFERGSKTTDALLATRALGAKYFCHRRLLRNGRVLLGATPQGAVGKAA